MRKVRSTTLLVLATGAVLVAAGACSSPSDDDPSESAGDDTETTEDGDGGSGGGGTETTAEGEGEDDRSSEDGGEDEAEPAESLGSSTARLPASPNDPTLVPLRLDVLGLERLEGMVELRVTLTNGGNSRTPDFQPFDAFDDPRLPTGDGAQSLSGAALVDADGERAYLTIVDSEGACLCTGRLADVAVPAGESYELYADFGGVPDDLDQVDVQVPGFPTVGAVPVG